LGKGTLNFGNTTQGTEHFLLDHKTPYSLATGFENCMLDYRRRMGHWQGSAEINNSSCKFSEYPEMKWAHELTIIKLAYLWNKLYFLIKIWKTLW